VEVKSCAKINLFLHVLGKRGDGYHDIYTLFCAVELNDTITLSFADKTHIICNKADIPADKNNIIFRVDQILRDEYGLKQHFKIELNKTIPAGAGLGGGSSNAAAYLQLVNKFAGMGFHTEDMRKILEKVGSDTSFFLYPPAALGEGRGEIITPLRIASKLWLLIVNPNISISTAAIYANKKIVLTERALLPKISSFMDLSEIVNIMVNGLEPAVFDVCPLTAELCAALEKAGALKAMVSGSGSSVFGVFIDREARDAAYERVRGQYSDYQIFKTASLQ